jgi:predicted membrane protein
MVSVWLTDEGATRLGLAEGDDVLHLGTVTDISYKESYVVVEDVNGYIYILLPEEVKRIDPR